MAKVELSITPEDDDIRVEVRCLDSDLHGKDAELVLLFVAEVKDKRPVHSERELLRRKFKLSGAPHTLHCNGAQLARHYGHDGKQLALKLVARLEVDDGILFDSKFKAEHLLPLQGGARPLQGDPKQMDPKDVFSFIANVAVLPARNKMIVLGLLIVGGFVVLGNLVLGFHDEFVPEAQTYFYDHTGDDGSESPIMKALMGSGAAGAGIWMAIMFQLRQYMRFQMKAHPPIGRDSRLRLSDLIDGESKVRLENVVVRVVACNRECGQYKRGSGTKERTVSFRNPINAVMLYERRILQIPAHRPLGMYIDGEVDFRPMFDLLLPPLMLSSSHGIDVAWEVQFLHPKFVDHELDGDCGALAWEDFVPDGRPAFPEHAARG